MDSDETPYLLPDGDRVWVINTSTAAELLPHMLERFRFGHLDPLIFGDANKPEAAIVPVGLLRSLDSRAFDEDGTNDALLRELHGRAEPQSQTCG